jgi:hypothetical protein
VANQSRDLSSVPEELRGFVEAAERRNDPGAWLGGDIHPLYRSRRRKSVGVLLLFQALLGAVLSCSELKKDSWLGGISIGVIALLFAGVGVRLFSPSRESEGRSDAEDR